MSSYSRNSQQGRQQNQSRPFQGSSSSSSYLMSGQRHDDDNGGRGGNRNDRGMGSGGGGGSGMMNRNQQKTGGNSMGSSSSSGSKAPVQSSKSIELPRRNLKVEILEKPGGEPGGVTNRSIIEDTDPEDQSFLDVVLLEDNVLTSIVKKLLESNKNVCEYENELQPQNLTAASLYDKSQATVTPLALIKRQLFDLLNYGMERKQKDREVSGQLLVFCIKNKFISKSVLLSMISQYVELVEEMLIDVPKYWQYLPEMLGRF